MDLFDFDNAFRKSVSAWRIRMIIEGPMNLFESIIRHSGLPSTPELREIFLGEIEKWANAIPEHTVGEINVALQRSGIAKPREKASKIIEQLHYLNNGVRRKPELLNMEDIKICYAYTKEMLSWMKVKTKDMPFKVTSVNE